MLIPEDLDARLRKAAQRKRVSKGEWVRQAIENALRASTSAATEARDPMARLASLEGPTGDIDRVLSEIEAGRK